MGGPAIIGGKPYPCFDNFHKCKFTDGEYEFNSSEQYYQFRKCYFLEDRQLILSAKNAYHAWELGQRVITERYWEKNKVQYMYKANSLKIEQNPKYKEKLIETKGDIEFPGCDPFWNKWNSLIYTLFRADLRLQDGDREKVGEIHDLMSEYRGCPNRHPGAIERKITRYL